MYSFNNSGGKKMEERFLISEKFQEVYSHPLPGTNGHCYQTLISEIKICIGDKNATVTQRQFKIIMKAIDCQTRINNDSNNLFVIQIANYINSCQIINRIEESVDDIRETPDQPETTIIYTKLTFEKAKTLTSKELLDHYRVYNRKIDRQLSEPMHETRLDKIKANLKLVTKLILEKMA